MIRKLKKEEKKKDTQQIWKQFTKKGEKNTGSMLAPDCHVIDMPRIGIFLIEEGGTDQIFFTWGPARPARGPTRPAQGPSGTKVKKI